MAVAFDTKATLFTGAATTSFTNASHTIGAISNGALIVYMQWGAVISSPVVKWDNTGTPQTMTLIGSKVESDNLAVSYLFGLIAPHTGLKTLSVSWTGSASYCGISASFSGADQTAFATTFKNLATDATTPSSGGNYPNPSGMAITTISGDMAVFGAATGNGAFATGSGLGTQLGFSNTNVSGDMRYLAAVGATTSVAANQSVASQPYCGVGCAIAAVGNVAGTADTLGQTIYRVRRLAA
jgi:hypothetical protein